MALRFVAGSLVGSLVLAAGAIAQPVLITAPQTLTPGQTTITPTGGGAPVNLATANITVSGTTLTINGAHSIGSLALQSSAVVTHTAGFTYDADPGPGVQTVGGFALTTTGNISIDVGSNINASSNGFTATQGPGAGGSVAANACSGRAGSGGHGGSGGSGNAASGVGGAPYDNFAQPVLSGSGGGNAGSSTGGRGGGTIKLNVGGSLAVNGTISANGESTAASGGAGGSIWITSSTITGNGAIRADGGSNNCFGTFGGGGGRVAIYGDRTGFTGSVSAVGSGASPGTQYFDGLPLTRPQLIYSGTGTTSLNEPLVTGPTVDVIIRNGAVLSCPIGSAAGIQLDIAGNLTVESGAAIDVTGRGFDAAQGPGAGGSVATNACSGRGSSGSYGGSGGPSNNSSVSVGSIYGSFSQPVDMGSGGGNAGSTTGGRGGGVVRINVGGALTLQGQVLATGESTSASGGSGGSIWITAGSISGNGAVRADGGTNNCWGTYGGGGGRVAIYGDRTGYSGSMSAAGSGAGPGTMYVDGLPTTRPRLMISGSGTTNYSQPLSTNANVDVFVQNGAAIGHTPESTNGLTLNVQGNLTIESGASVNVSTCGFGPATGPGAGGSTATNACSGRGASGSHGGSGGPSNNPVATTGPTYGSYNQPIDLGSGGGNAGSSAGGRGGGAARINVAGTLIIQGQVLANGETTSASGGSGGSIWISAGDITGNGAIRADGGGNSCWGTYGGGGGRIAIYGNRTTFAGSTSAEGAGAGPGSMYFNGLPAAQPQLIYSGNGRSALSAPLIIGPGVDVFIRSGAQIGHAEANVDGITIEVADNLTIESGSGIDVTNQGFGSASGPGAGGSTATNACSGRGGSAGHGGLGIAGNVPSATPGAVYGSSTQPTTLGSGGGNAGSSAGGRGGGAVRVTTGGTLTVNGFIRADGEASSASGGSGGSIWITTQTLAGNGQITASGGNNNCAGTFGGGGGRIAAYSCFNNFTGTTSANSSGGNAGTVRIETIAGSVAAVASAFCTGDLATLSVDAAGVGTITYQWRRNGVDVANGLQPSGATYAGANSPTLSITHVTQDEAGTYDVRVTASCATIVSNSVPVDVIGASPFPCDNIDFNNDCSAYDPQDIDAFLSVYSEGPCIPETGTCNDIDFNNDSSLFDPCDIDSFLLVFSEGPCTPCGV